MNDAVLSEYANALQCLQTLTPEVENFEAVKGNAQNFMSTTVPLILEGFYDKRTLLASETEKAARLEQNLQLLMKAHQDLQVQYKAANAELETLRLPPPTLEEGEKDDPDEEPPAVPPTLEELDKLDEEAKAISEGPEEDPDEEDLDEDESDDTDGRR